MNVVHAQNRPYDFRISKSVTIKKHDLCQVGNCQIITTELFNPILYKEI